MMIRRLTARDARLSSFRFYDLLVHVFVVILGNAFPVNVLNQVKSVSEVCSIFCATGNPVRVLIAGDAEGAGPESRRDA